MNDETKTFSRRDFVKLSTTAFAGLTIVPAGVVSGLGHRAPSDKLNIAVVGIGGVGFRNLNHLKQESIVALCDVDSAYGEKSYRRWGDARRYKDYRVMLDQERNLDAVVVATPDHTHSVIAMAAMQLQKHVYVQAPMAHSVFEARRMVETARVFNVVSQVGNQIASGEGTRLISELIWSGFIGEVREVHAWTSQPHWIQGEPIKEYRLRMPRELDWDLFIGPASPVDYHPVYTPYTWRGWWNFGNGTLGSMGPHLLEPVFRALKLNAPVSVQASSSEFSLEYAPKTSKIVFGFSRRDNLPKVALPAVKLYWYDGGLRPEYPEGLPDSAFQSSQEDGVIIKGSEGLITCTAQGEGVTVYKDGRAIEPVVERLLHRIADPFTGGHEADFVRACKESGTNRLLPSADFESQLPLNETILVGNLALRLQSLNRKLLWDSARMKFSNLFDSDQINLVQTGEMINDNGLLRPNLKTVSVEALPFVEQTIRPVYRAGWPQI